MHMVKIGILDEEQEYVQMLSAYLGRYGKGNWLTAAFTDRQVLSSYLDKGQLDIVAGTNQEELRQLQGTYKPLSFLWLSGRQETEKHELGFYEIYRYQSAKAIGKMLEEMIAGMAKTNGFRKPVIAIYSPVGRCGKTTLALEIVQQEKYGRWIYIGMEDYSSFSGEGLSGGTESRDFFYHVKERQEDKLLSIIESSNGVIDSGRSLFDTRQMEYADMEWLMEVLPKCEHTGAVFDIGTGVLADFRILSLFDHVLVPYLKGEISMIKKKNFEEMLAMYCDDVIARQIDFINMSNRNEVEGIMKHFLEEK